MIRVVLADDEAVVRAGVRGILAADPELAVVGEAGDGRSAVDLVRRHRPDVALIDIRMPLLDGLAATAEIRREAPETAVVILTTFGEDDYLARAIDLGAAGFLLKSGHPAELLTGVREVARGASCLSPAVTHRLLASLRGGRLARGAAARARVGTLTARERDVLRLLAAGRSNAQIARSLFLVEGTVKGHVSAILLRLGVDNRVQAAIVAVEAGLVGEDAAG